MGEGALLLAFVTGQRAVELIWAQRNTRRLIAQGGVEYGRRHYSLMVALHAAWLAGLWLVGRDRAVDLPLLAAFVALQIARLWVIASLGRRWTTRVVVVPGETLIAAGPYRLFRHPNYLIVLAEIVVVPLALGLTLYAALFGALNAALLAYRVRVEEAALARARGRGTKQATNQATRQGRPSLPSRSEGDS
jgi:methyltransferase